MTIFNRQQLQQNQIRAFKNFAQYNFLHQEIGQRMLENLALLADGKKAKNYAKILEIGIIESFLQSAKNDDNFSKNVVFSQENAPKITKTAIFANKNADLIVDDEDLHFEENSFDLVFSNLNLQFINQIPQFLVNIKNILKKDGVFIASFFGEENLKELNHAMQISENEICGGISPRLPPTIDVKTAAMLLQKAGFKDPISSLEKIEVNYKEPISLLKDLKNMAFGNILQKKSKKFFTKKLLQRLLENYQKFYGNEERAIKASFEIVIICGKK